MSESLITSAISQQIDQWVAKFPAEGKRSAVVMALRLVQEQNGGWLTADLMDAVAEYLDLPKIAVYEVGTFYDMFYHKPVGKHKIAVCTNVSCMLRGSDEIVAHFKKCLGVGLGETTADGQFSLVEVECMAACGGAPMCQVDNKDYHENLTPEKIDSLLEKIKQGGVA